MSKVRFKWKTAGFKEIRSSPGVQDAVEAQCIRVANSANSASVVRRAKYGYSTQQGKSRFRGIVFTDNYRARVDNAKHNTLLRAL